MKKQLLFVMNNLRCGGAEKSLVTLLNCINYSKYEVDLFLFDPSGEFIHMLPKQVNLLQSSKYWSILNGPFKSSIIPLIKDLRFDLVLSRVIQTIICRILRASEKSEQYLWRNIRRAFTPLKKNYDAAIGYLERNPIYFVVDKVNAKKKIGWIHNSYDKFSLNLKIEEKYFSRLNFLVTVSKECANVLTMLFNKQRSKIVIIENIILPSIIIKMAEEEIPKQNPELLRLVTVARLAPQKGIDIALEACYLLVMDGYKFTWSILGEGLERCKLERKIQQYNLDKIFLLEGIKTNPYPYIKNADIYVQPSRFEGKSIAIEEAKILNKPIIVTNYNTVIDQIQNDVNGLITEIDAKGIYQGIKRLIDNPQLRIKLSSHLNGDNLSNENEIRKFYEMIEE